jgi:hypothetical protein
LHGKFEPDRAASLFLTDRCSIERGAVGSYVIDANCHDITASQFAVDGEVEQSEIAVAALNLQLGSDRPNVACSQRRLRTDQLAFIPRLTAQWTAGWHRFIIVHDQSPW